jgi:hypothetical protein
MSQDNRQEISGDEKTKIEIKVVKLPWDAIIVLLQSNGQKFNNFVWINGRSLLLIDATYGQTLLYQFINITARIT